MKDQEPWRPTPGDLIQCWDSKSPHNRDDRLREHGRLGYVVRLSKKTDTFTTESGVHSLTHISEGNCSKCIFFADGKHEVIHVAHEWLRKVNDASDIRKVEDV